MPSYRCYFLAAGERLAGPPEIIECNVPADAIRKAEAMLLIQPQYEGIEVWDGAKRVFPLALPQHTISFLRMAAVELRRVAADRAWHAADAARLRHIADQCDAEADELVERS
jgi:hypothetical protein